MKYKFAYITIQLFFQIRDSCLEFIPISFPEKCHIEKWPQATTYGVYV